MKFIFLAVIAFFSFHSIGQTYFGIPFLDQSRKLGSCPVCKNKEDTTILLLENIGNEYDLIFDKEEAALENYLIALSFFDSLLSTSDFNDIIKSRLILEKIKIYCTGIVENGDEVYNFAISEGETLLNFMGPTKIIDLFDEIIALDIDEQSKNYFRNAKLSYFTRSFLFYEIDRQDYSAEWIKNEEKRAQLPPMERALAQNYVESLNLTSFNPLFYYDAHGVGVTASFGKENWYGVEFSFDVQNETVNPFIRYHRGLGYRNDYRISWISTKILVNQNVDKVDFLVGIYDIKNYRGFKLNLAQFGLHSSTQYEDKIFYRPEIGYSYGIFTLSYGYNFTLDQTIRPITEKHLVNFTISYPLIRVGKYY